MQGELDATPIEVMDASTSYFSTPGQSLDPSIFDGHHLKPEVRDWLVHTVNSFLAERFIHPEGWTRLWVAGSGVSYQWEADRDPADLDLMLGIHYTSFRHANPDYAGYSDSEIASTLNELMHEELYPEIEGVSFGRSTFEVTVYVNKGVGTDPDSIRFINPYAAYDLTGDEWVVPPNPNPMVRVHPSWRVTVESDLQRAHQLVAAYNDALNTVHGATNPAHRRNGELHFQRVLDVASALYDEIHHGRRAAFTPAGQGYADFTNYRWQSGKANGVVPVLKRLAEYGTAYQSKRVGETYGVELPDADVLRRRAMNYKAPR